MREMKLYAALDLYLRGFNLMKLRAGSKRPALATWKHLQLVRLTRVDLQNLFSTDGELAIITGEIEETKVNVLAIDFDSPQEFEAWDGPESNMIEQTQNGFHAYYQLPLGERVPNRVGVDGKEMDYRHQGGYSKCAPSESDSGFIYRWIKGPVTAKELVMLPREFAQEHKQEEKIASVDGVATAVRRTIIRSVSNPEQYCLKIQSLQGANGSAALVRAIAVLRDSGRTPTQTFEFLRDVWNRQCATPPWLEVELAHAVKRHYGIN